MALSAVFRAPVRFFSAKAAAATHYDVLGLTPSASAKDVKAQYYKLSLQHHPDRNMNMPEEAEARFKRVNEAYLVLGDHVKRAAYDTTLGVGRPPSQQHTGHHHQQQHHQQHQQQHQQRQRTAHTSGPPPTGFHGAAGPGGFDQRTHYWEHYGRHFKERQQREREHDELMREGSGSTFWPIVALLVSAAVFVRLVMANVDTKRTRQK